jgi:hypothetical protein
MAPRARPCPPTAGRAQGGTPPWAVADILRRYGHSYCEVHPVPPPPRQVMHDLMGGRTAALGGHAEPCAQCGCKRYAYHACRNRHGPTCQTRSQAKWLADRKADLLEVPSFPCGFPLPPALPPSSSPTNAGFSLCWFRPPAKRCCSLDTRRPPAEVIGNLRADAA